MTTTTRRMVYAQIANAVLAGLPEPPSQHVDGDKTYAWLEFDSHDDARLWARWVSPGCVDSERWQDHEKTGSREVSYWGQRPGGDEWGWNIVGREPIVHEHQYAGDGLCACERSLISSSRDVDGNDRPEVQLPEGLRSRSYRCEGCGKESRIAAHKPGCSVAPPKLAIPCGRCGHDENGADGGHFPGDRGGWMCGLCPGGICSPVVLVPAGVDGWAIQGRAQ